MIEFTLVLLAFFVGIAVASVILINLFSGLLARGNLTAEQRRAMFLTDKDSAEEKVNNSLPNIAITVEEENGEMFAYRKSDNRFLAQSNNYSELIQRTADRVGNSVISVYMTEETHDKLKPQLEQHLEKKAQQA